MPLPSLKDTPAGRLGFHGEEEIKRWLLKQRVGVISNTAIATGGAPSVEFEDQKITLPDFTIAKYGRCALVEVKTVTDFTRRDKGTHAGKYQHGVPHAKVLQYLNAEKQTGMPVWLCVYLARPFRSFNGVYMGLLATLVAAGSRVGHTYCNKERGIWNHYFNVEAFEQFQGPQSQLPSGQLPVSKSIRMQLQPQFAGVAAHPERFLFDEENPIIEETIEAPDDDRLDNDLSDIDQLLNRRY